MSFKLKSKFKPSVAQQEAIEKIIKSIKANNKHQILLGVTGSGKTFTMANVIEKLNVPVIVLSHNKTLASQLYSELKSFFPNSNVEYFVSYFDYYRPEAYLPKNDVYIDKSSQTNRDIEAMRISTLNSLLKNPNNTIVVSSVAAIYGLSSPKNYQSSFFTLNKFEEKARNNLFLNLVKQQYKRVIVAQEYGTFSVKGDVVEISPSWTSDYNIRIDFFDEDIEKIQKIDKLNKTIIEELEEITFFPASSYAIDDDNTINDAICLIELELEQRLKYFLSLGKQLEYERLKNRVENDLDSLREFNFCSGIENYSAHLEKRKSGQKPFTIFDYLPKNSLIIIDESHMSIPQLNGMYNGDHSRKVNLVDYGFRLPSALDNRPLMFKEFEEYNFPRLYISATPGKYELEKTKNEVITQFIRPTGLLDPIIEIVPTKNQIEHIYDQLIKQRQKNERSIIIAITKKTAEEFSKFLISKNIKIAYIHSEHNVYERNEILRKLRKGVYEAIIGINLLREGIDLPEVSLIMVLDADKESFFRSKSSLIQISGRAARNVNGKVIFYADTISKSMQECIDDNAYKRKIQIEYNKKYNIIPKSIIKPIPELMLSTTEKKELLKNNLKSKNIKEKISLISSLREKMLDYAKKLEFEKAGEIRDLILELEADERK